MSKWMRLLLNKGSNFKMAIYEGISDMLMQELDKTEKQEQKENRKKKKVSVK